MDRLRGDARVHWDRGREHLHLQLPELYALAALLEIPLLLQYQ
jgi:hypothetical protein